MTGLIEVQQVISHSALVEKVQHVKQENLLIHQQYSVEEMKERNLKRQRKVIKADESEAMKIRDREKERQKRDNKKRENNEGNDGGAVAQDHSEYRIDVHV